MPSPSHIPAQGELPLSSVLSHRLFPGRASLAPWEVAKVLGVTERHVRDLIEEGSIEAVDVSGDNNKSARKHWRIPVAAYDAFLAKRHNLSTSGAAGNSSPATTEPGRANP